MSISPKASQRVQLTVLHILSGEAVCASNLYEGLAVILLRRPRQRKEIDMVNVGKSEKSPENIL